jgi:hypothetical protein
MATKEEEMLQNDPDYILLRRFGYSIRRVEARYPDGAPDHLIAPALGLKNEEAVKAAYDRIVEKLRQAMEIK